VQIGKRLPGYNFVDDVEEQKIWDYSAAPLHLRCTPACPVGREREKEGEALTLINLH